MSSEQYFGFGKLKQASKEAFEFFEMYGTDVIRTEYRGVKITIERVKENVLPENENSNATLGDREDVKQLKPAGYGCPF